MQEVQRVMHERAAYVDLHPEIENVCMDNLAKFCSDHTGPRDEITCLQDNLEQLSKECKHAVSNYTEAEAKDTKLNAELTIQCASAIPQVSFYCNYSHLVINSLNTHLTSLKISFSLSSTLLSSLSA
nr:Golgi apparatus protein 1-like [Cherax quadricarinatus]